MSLQEGHMQKLRIRANNCAVSLAKGKYFINTIGLVFLFKCVEFGGSFLGHIRRQLLGAVWLQKSRQPGLQHCHGVYFTGQKAANSNKCLSVCLIHACCAFLCGEVVCCKDEATVRGHSAHTIFWLPSPRWSESEPSSPSAHCWVTWHGGKNLSRVQG